MKVLIPAARCAPTPRRAQVEAEGDTLDALFADLDRRYPGLRFRVVDEQGQLRPNMRVFVNGRACATSAIRCSPTTSWPWCWRSAAAERRA
jgi:sulfur-carrier protein